MCDPSMWVTVDLLVGHEKRRTERDLVEDVKEWLDTVVARIAANNAAPETPSSVGIPELPRTASTGGARRSAQKKKQQQTSYCNTDCSFTYPQVCSRLERLMGTNVVRITDRDYMLRLQARIRQDHEENVRRRIHDREIGEVEREKRLILEGKMAVEEAPAELANHPVFKITQLTNEILEERRKKAQAQKRQSTAKGFNYDLLNLSGEDKDGESGLESKIEFDLEYAGRLRRLQEIDSEFETGSMFTQEDYDRIKYESPLVKQLRTLETVDELYKLADEIVGPIRHTEKSITKQEKHEN